MIARRAAGRWAGVLLEGPSGAGKSDLALRAMQQGWRLVADDRVIAWTSAGRLFGRAPAALAGLIEVRGLGVLGTAPLPFAEITLVAACVAPGAERDRIPEPRRRTDLGVAMPQVTLSATEPSALAKLERALAGL